MCKNISQLSVVNIIFLYHSILFQFYLLLLVTTTMWSIRTNDGSLTIIVSKKACRSVSYRELRACPAMSLICSAWVVMLEWCLMRLLIVYFVFVCCVFSTKEILIFLWAHHQTKMFLYFVMLLIHFEDVPLWKTGSTVLWFARRKWMINEIKKFTDIAPEHRYFCMIIICI